MSSILHVLNGDSTAHSFNDTGLEGDVLVWREIFSQGPLLENVSSAAFWNARSVWISKTFGDVPENYEHKVVEPLEKLNGDYKEINLWFEFDLHCQANLLGVMEMIAERADLTEQAIYLICPGEFPGKPDFKGMGELNGEELEYLYDNIRAQLTEYDFELANEAWKLYVSDDIGGLQKWLKETTFWGNMPLLQPAMAAHLKRLTQNETGLNYIEQKLLDIYKSGKTTRYNIYQGFWSTEKIFGMGDAEIDIYLQNLTDKNLISI